MGIDFCVHNPFYTATRQPCIIHMGYVVCCICSYNVKKRNFKFVKKKIKKSPLKLFLPSKWKKTKRKNTNLSKKKNLCNQTIPQVCNQTIPAYKLEVWPGYITPIREQEGGLLLLFDSSHRVLRQTWKNTC